MDGSGNLSTQAWQRTMPIRPLPANPAGAEDAIEILIDEVQRKGVALWAERGRLHFKAPKGVLTSQEVEQLRAQKEAIVRLIERSSPQSPVASTTAVAANPPTAPDITRAPLTYPQLEHWRGFRLHERPAIRQVASATRLRGRLDAEAFLKSLAEMPRRHPALRTRIILINGEPMQEVPLETEYDIRAENLSDLPGRYQELEVRRRIEELILEPIDVSSGPLFGARLLRLCHHEHVLVLAMEHIISDGFSLDILLRDILAAYSQLSSGREIALPEVPVQFTPYILQQRHLSNSQTNRHTNHWRARLAAWRPLKLPADRLPSGATQIGWGTAAVHIEKPLKSNLRDWCRSNRTTPAMAMFTAYAALLCRWCDVKQAVLRYQSDGRASPKLHHTIGYFATMLYVEIELQPQDHFFDLLHRATQAYCQAFQYGDGSEVLAQAPKPEFTLNPAFNWVPQERHTATTRAPSDNDLTLEPIQFTHPMIRTLAIDSEPSLLLFDRDEEITGDFYFPLSRFSIEGMERLARNLRLFVIRLISAPERPISDITLI